MNRLKMINANGLSDPYEAIKLSYGDQILGLWGVERGVGTSNHFSETENSDDFLLFRWDKRYVICTEGERYSGVYHVNGHRPEVTLIPSDEKLGKSNWEIQLDQNRITLKNLNSDSIVTRRFKRIYEFPE